MLVLPKTRGDKRKVIVLFYIYLAFLIFGLMNPNSRLSHTMKPWENNNVSTWIWFCLLSFSLILMLWWIYFKLPVDDI